MRKIDMNHQMTVEEIKAEILRRFNDKVRHKKPDIAKEVNARHDGKQGHWLEQQMGLKANRSNDPDMYGFEMKNHTRGKTTFGDWSADYYIFKDANYGISRDSFLQIFGKPNQDKKGRCSWSGEPAPKIQGFNSFGQRLVIDNENNILAVYCFSQDQRPHKRQVVPPNLQKENLILAQWHYQSIKTKLENKFNQYKKESKIRCSVESTDGSLYNLNTLKNGELDFGIVQSDIVYQASKGEGAFKDAKFPKFRSVMAIYPELLTLVTKKDANINKLLDIKNKRIKSASFRVFGFRNVCFSPG